MRHTDCSRPRSLLLAFSLMGRFLGAIILFSCSLFCEEVIAAETGGQLVISQPIFDFGSVPEGTKVTHDFMVANKGDAELELLRVVPGCGCTVTQLEKKILQPGEEGKLSVEFDTEGFSGEKAKAIRLYTSDARNSVFVLTLQGTIEPEILVTPKRVFFGNLFPDDNNRSVEVRVKIREESPLELVSIKNYSRSLELEEVERDAKSAHFRLRVSDDVAQGDLRDRIVLNLTGGSPRAVNVPVFASIKGPVKIQPSSLSFGVIEGNAPLERTIRIENSSDEPLQIEGVSSDDDSLSLDVKTLEDGKVYLLKIQVDPRQVEKVLRTVIRVKTSHGKQSELNVSVYGIKPPGPA